MTLRRALPILVILAGGAVALHALFSLAGGSLPYPDPTPALLAQQAHDLASARMRLWTGAGLLLGGLFLAVLQVLRAARPGPAQGAAGGRPTHD